MKPMDLTVKKKPPKTELSFNCSFETTDKCGVNDENILDLSVKLSSSSCKLEVEEGCDVKVIKTSNCDSVSEREDDATIERKSCLGASNAQISCFIPDHSKQGKADIDIKDTYSELKSPSISQRQTKQSPKVNNESSGPKIRSSISPVEKTGDDETSDQTSEDNLPDCLDYLGKYSMPLESERGLYVTGATILAMKGIISYNEYTTNKFTRDIPQDLLDKKFYLGAILGAIRGMTRLRLARSKERLPSVTMFDHMKHEESELIASGCKFVTDSEESDEEDEEVSTNGTTSQSSNKRSGKTLASRTSLKNCAAKSSKISADTSPPKLRSQRKLLTDSVKKKIKDDSRSVDHETEYEKELPDELLICGDCGISISSIQHLDRHLERCRGSKRRQTTQAQSKRMKTQQTATAADRLASVSGKLYVCDTDDGEVICGWESTMKGIPPGPTCPRCAYDIPTLYDFPFHQRYHTGTEKLTCPVCPFSTFSIPVYLVHVEEHAT